MDDAKIPEGLVDGINATITEAVRNLAEVTRYAHGNEPFDVPRMVLYLLGDAIDTLSQISRVVAPYYRERGLAEHDLLSFLQPGQRLPLRGHATTTNRQPLRQDDFKVSSWS
ncbi:hypothetical protein ACIQU4_26540 [Streptomyces sp. NPDC090741]|uniref:hypothetical protein n=1 Tax=Streptomyces sp. NPDC090741 TaxID=3365967 RepID=UPI003818F85C